MKKINKIIITSILLSVMFVLAYAGVKPGIVNAATSGSILMNYDYNGGADPDCVGLPTNGDCIPWGDGTDSSNNSITSAQFHFCLNSAVKYASGLSDISELQVSYVEAVKQPAKCLANENNGTYKTYNVSFAPKCTPNASQKCVGNSVYNFNSCGVQGSLIQTCASNQTCQNAQCVNIACSSNSQCGTNGFIGGLFCQDNNVYQNYITYACNNPGTASSSCINLITAQLQTTCTGSQTCADGSCTTQNIVCSANTDCGTNSFIGNPFCQGNNVYKNYITYTCNNPGTASSSCSNSTTAQLQTTCTGSQTCADGSCTNTCTSNYQQRCFGNNLYWYDSCGNQQNFIQYCPNGCSNNSCTNSICTYHSYERCSGNYLYWYDSCGNQQDLAQYCPNGCSNNSCQNNYNYVTVQTNSATNVYNNQATLNGYLSGSNNYSCNNYVWFQWGNSNSYGYETTHQQQNYTGSFSKIINNVSSGNTYHFRAVAQDCSGNTTYGQDMTIYSDNISENLIITKTVRNLTNGSGFSNSTYANPSDMLMFMITLRASGNQNIQNVLVRDTLPTSLVYNNQLVVACTNNSNYNNCNNNNYNYSGNITYGINLNTIYAGQTVTITYQVQVASAQNFSYGTTTLNNNVSVTSSQSGYTPISNASVIVSRSAVLGASAVSTGLTNNFWIDSFILPLIITLIGIWMWRAGMFFGIEKWLDNKRKIRRGYKSGKEFSARIAKISRLENNRGSSISSGQKLEKA